MTPDSPKPSGWRALRKPLIALLIVGAALFGAQLLRRQAGIEFSANSIQQTVAELGLWAPVGYILLVVFRQAMALPSAVLLTAAGLLFGAPMGTLLGGFGVTLNAVALFVCARMLGRDWVMPQIHSRFPEFEDRSKTAGPFVIALMTGHPMGVLTPFHFVAGVTEITPITFLLSVGPAAIFRAGCYSFLGANLLDPGSPRFWMASGVMLVAALLPLAHPGLRGRLMRGRKGRGDPKEPPSEPGTVSTP